MSSDGGLPPKKGLNRATVWNRETQNPLKKDIRWRRGTWEKATFMFVSCLKDRLRLPNCVVIGPGVFCWVVCNVVDSFSVTAKPWVWELRHWQKKTRHLRNNEKVSEKEKKRKAKKWGNQVQKKIGTDHCEIVKSLRGKVKSNR